MTRSAGSSARVIRAPGKADADQHAKDDVRRTLMRLDVLGQLVETSGKYTLPAADAEPG
jgi:hypothetical protein